MLIDQITKQENEDRFIASQLITDTLIKNQYTNIQCKGTPITESIDLNCKCTKQNKDYKFNVEIKKNNKTDYEFSIYPHALLRRDKLERMLEQSQDIPLYYMVLLNEKTCYLYNIRKIDWTKIELVNLHLKRTQLDDYSPYICYPTYRIPYNLAAKADISKYYADYKQTCQKKEIQH